MRILSSLTFVLILIYGIFKIWVLNFYSSFLQDFFGPTNLFSILKNQAIEKRYEEQAVGWILYYPTYFILHITFIFLLFNKTPKTRNYLMLCLTGFISLLIFLWVFCLFIGLPELATFFRGQFRKLFGLPFILLAIEGGRILYFDLKKRSSGI